MNSEPIIDSYDRAKTLIRSGKYIEAETILSGLESKITDDYLLILVKAELLRIGINLGKGNEKKISYLLKRAQDIDFPKGIAECKNLLVHYNMMTGKYAKVQDIIVKSDILDLFGKLGDVRGLGNLLVSKSLASLVIDDIDSSEAEIRRAFILFDKIKDINGQINALLILGRIARRKNDEKAAQTSFREALTMAYETGNKGAIAECRRVLTGLDSQFP